MKVLLSIKPEHADKIFEGTKKFEFRRSSFRNQDVKTVVVYATLPVGRVIGEFTIGEIIETNPDDLWKRTHAHSGISSEFFYEYFAGRNSATAIAVTKPKRYKKALNIADVSPSGIAPQSFCYLT